MNTDIYHVIHRRRDVRAQFSGEPVPDDVLERVLDAAHAAPSVGLSQPWDFVLVRDRDTRQAFHDHVQRERAVFAASLTGGEAERFARIKIDGVLESSLSVIVTYDAGRGGPAVLGRRGENGLLHGDEQLHPLPARLRRRRRGGRAIGTSLKTKSISRGGSSTG